MAEVPKLGPRDAGKTLGHGFFYDQLSPGMLIYTFAEGLVVPSFNFTGLAFLHNELNHTGPTVVGDTIHVEVEVTEVRRASKGNRGLVRSLNHVVNHRDEVVLIYKPLRMVSGSPEAGK